MNPTLPSIKQADTFLTVNNLRNEIDSYNQFSNVDVEVSRLTQLSEYLRDEVRLDLVPRLHYNLGSPSTISLFFAFRLDGHPVTVDKVLELVVALELDNVYIYPSRQSLSPGNQDPVRPETYHDVWAQTWFDYTWRGSIAPITMSIKYYVVSSPPSLTIIYFFNLLSTKAFIGPPKRFVNSDSVLDALDWVGDELQLLFATQ